MKELSLNVLDITQNSIKAGARHIAISLIEDDNHLLTMTISDDGCGMTPATLMSVTNPFYTTRKTRKVGLGLPLLRLAAEQAGGEIKIESVSAEDNDNKEKHGTTVTATFYTDKIDFTPVGDMVSTICVIIQGNPEIDYSFRHMTPEFDVRLETIQLRDILGEETSLAEPEVMEWISGYLSQQYSVKKVNMKNNSEDIKL